MPAILRLTPLSSTTKTRNDVSNNTLLCADTLASGAATVARSAGIRTEKQVPSPTALRNVMEPPKASLSRLQIARPNPVPPNFRVEEEST